MQLKPLFISLMCLVQAHAVQAREYPSPSALRGDADIQKETLIKQLDDSKYAIEMGDLIMVVDAGHGGKILSFKCQDVEVISQSPHARNIWQHILDKSSEGVELASCAGV